MYSIGYGRVSTREQAEDGYSLITQEEKLQKHFKENKMENTKIFIDDGYSAKDLKRPAIKEIIKLIYKRMVKVIVVTKIDRLSRDINDYSFLINLCIDYKVEIITIEENTDLSNASGRVVNYIKSTFAQYERELISERTIDGYYGKALKGEYPYSNSPLGYDKTSTHQLIVNNDIEIVKEIYSWYQNTCDIDITKRMVNAKYQKKYTFDSILRVLKNTIYFGYKIIKGEKFYFVDPVIDEKTYVRVKENLNSYNKPTRYTHKHIGKYKYYNRVFHDDRLMRHETKKKNGKQYKYYYDRISGMYINEVNLDKFLFDDINNKQLTFIEDSVNSFLATNDEEQLTKKLKYYKKKYRKRKIDKIEVINKETFKVYYE